MKIGDIIKQDGEYHYVVTDRTGKLCLKNVKEFERFY